MTELKRIKEAFEAHGWRCGIEWNSGPECDWTTLDARSGRDWVAVYGRDWHGWGASINAEDGACEDDTPLAALRSAYADCDSRRVRAVLRPVLVALREPGEEGE